MAVDETPLWNRLAATARDAPVVENGVFLPRSSIAEPLTALMLREVRIAREARRRERWLWRVELLALAASLLRVCWPSCWWIGEWCCQMTNVRC